MKGGALAEQDDEDASLVLSFIAQYELVAFVGRVAVSIHGCAVMGLSARRFEKAMEKLISEETIYAHRGKEGELWWYVALERSR